MASLPAALVPHLAERREKAAMVAEVKKKTFDGFHFQKTQIFYRLDLFVNKLIT